MKKISTALQVSGAVLITAGIAMLSVPIAVIVGGIFSIVFGVAVERSNAK